MMANAALERLSALLRQEGGAVAATDEKELQMLSLQGLERASVCEPGRLFSWWAYFFCMCGIVALGYAALCMFIIGYSYTHELYSAGRLEGLSGEQHNRRAFGPASAWELCIWLLVGMSLLCSLLSLVVLGLFRRDSGPSRA